VYWVLGDEFFCNGTALWCLRRDNGRVVRIDYELADPIELVNTSVGRFASALWAAVMWSEASNRGAASWPREVDQLEAAIGALDPECLAAHRSFWRAILDFERAEGPTVAGFKRPGPRDPSYCDPGDPKHQR
jgi:hypothetical protein